MTGSLDVTYPYHPDTPGRTELLRYTAGRWTELYAETYGVRVYVAGDGGSEEPGPRPFNRGLARNRAAAQGTGDWLALWDVDVPAPSSEERLASAIRTAGRYGWSPVWSRTVTFSPQGTRRLLDAAAAGFSYAVGPGDMYNLLPMCKGPTIVKRRVFEFIGGYDSRFNGWGHEDTALRAVLGALYGQPLPPPGDEVCWSLSLDPEDPNKREENIPNRELYMREYTNLDRGKALDLLTRLRTQ